MQPKLYITAYSYSCSMQKKAKLWCDYSRAVITSQSFSYYQKLFDVAIINENFPDLHQCHLTLKFTKTASEVCFFSGRICCFPRFHSIQCLWSHVVTIVMGKQNLFQRFCRPEKLNFFVVLVASCVVLGLILVEFQFQQFLSLCIFPQLGSPPEKWPDMLTEHSHKSFQRFQLPQNSMWTMADSNRTHPL